MARDLEGWVTECRSVDIPIPPTANLSLEDAGPANEGKSVHMSTQYNELFPSFHLRMVLRLRNSIKSKDWYSRELSL
jgi:hypothetical protein